MQLLSTTHRLDTDRRASLLFTFVLVGPLFEREAVFRSSLLLRSSVVRLLIERRLFQMGRLACKRGVY